MALYLKESVNLNGLHSRVVWALAVAVDLYERLAGIDCWVTSGKDGQHMHGSKHYQGKALDFRTKTLPSAEAKQKLVVALRTAVGKDFDVILEHLGGVNEHIHLELDPKGNVGVPTT